MISTGRRTGRPLKAAVPGARVSLGLKVIPEIKTKLDDAARLNGRTQSAEAEFRLEQSFVKEAELGGPEVANLVRLMTAAFIRGGKLGAHARGKPKWTPAEWMNDSHCYEAAAQSVWDALALAMPETAKYKGNRPDLHSAFATMAARGANIKVRRGDEK